MLTVGWSKTIVAVVIEEPELIAFADQHSFARSVKFVLVFA